MPAIRSILRRPLIALIVVAASAACGGTADTFLTATQTASVDRGRPNVVGTLPGNGATNVPTNSLIEVTFSEPIDSTSVTNATLSFSGGVTGTLTVRGSLATLVPYPALPANTTITGTVSGVRDVAGNPVMPYVWSFTTGEPALPVSR